MELCALWRDNELDNHVSQLSRGHRAEVRRVQRGSYVDENVGNVEDRQRDVEVIALELEVCGETVDTGIANVASIDEGEQPEAEEPGYNVGVEFPRNAPVEGRIDVEKLVCLLVLCILWSRIQGELLLRWQTVCPLRLSREGHIEFPTGGANHIPPSSGKGKWRNRTL